MSTKVQWISHASCLICYNDYFLLTDPWFFTARSILNETNTVNSIIPFKDLSVGYLGEWSRTPKNYYNYNFITHVLHKHAHEFFNCNVIDK